jgi:hypothetical protein
MKAKLELLDLLEELEQRAARPGLDVFEDRSLEVLSRVQIDALVRDGASRR